MRSASTMRAAIAGITSQHPAQSAFAYVLQHPGVAAGILGTTRVESLEQVLQTVPERLDTADRERLVSAFGDGSGSPSH